MIYVRIYILKHTYIHTYTLHVQFIYKHDLTNYASHLF